MKMKPKIKGKAPAKQGVPPEYCLMLIWGMSS